MNFVFFFIVNEKYLKFERHVILFHRVNILVFLPKYTHVWTFYVFTKLMAFNQFSCKQAQPEISFKSLLGLYLVVFVGINCNLVSCSMNY